MPLRGIDRPAGEIPDETDDGCQRGGGEDADRYAGAGDDDGERARDVHDVAPRIEEAVRTGDRPGHGKQCPHRERCGGGDIERAAPADDDTAPDEQHHGGEPEQHDRAPDPCAREVAAGLEREPCDDGGREHRDDARHAYAGTVRTILPSCSPASSRACASRISESGTTSSTTGRARPSAISRYAPSKSSFRPIVDPRIESCFHQIRWRAAGGFGPVVAPHTAIRPP